MVNPQSLFHKLYKWYGKPKDQELPEIVLTADEACYLSALVMVDAERERRENEK
jgi:hypothetical protein